jgi:hypothetical protein
MKKLLFFTVAVLPTFCSGFAQLRNNTARIVMSPGSYLVLNDMGFVNNGVFTQSSGIVRIMGENNSVISGTVQPQFYSLQIAKNATKEVQLLTHVNVAGDVSFLSGLVNLNNRNIFLLGTATIKGETELRRIMSTTGGYIETTTTLNAPVSVNPGNLGIFISTTKNLGLTTIRRGHQPQIIGGGNNNSLFRYYDIIPTNNIDLNATLRFQYFDAELNGLNEANLALFKKVNNITWTNEGATIRNATTNYVYKTAITNFFRWTVSTPANIPGKPSQLLTENRINPNTGITKTLSSVFIENLYPTIGEMQNIYIKTGNMDMQKIQVQLYDIQGRLVSDRQIRYQSQWLALPLLPAGMYKLVIRSGEQVYQQGFIKQ